MVETQDADKFLTESGQIIFTEILPFELTEIRTRTISSSLDMTTFYSKVGLGHLE
jgi:hypothetical protein